MKKFIFLSGVFFILCSTSVSFSQWSQIGPNSGSSTDPIPVINDLYVSGDTIYSVDNLFGLHYSTDSGVTWCEMTYNSGNNNSCAASNGVILMGNQFYVSRSTNFGTSFSDVTIPGYINDLSIKNNMALCAGTSALFYSKNAGLNWSISISGTFSSVLVSPGVFFAGNNNGVYRSVDSVNFVSCLSPRVVNALAANGNNIYAGSTTGVDYSSDAGISWNPTALTSNVKDIAVSGTNIFAISGTLVYKSTNNGQSWTVVYNSGAVLKQIRATPTAIIAMDNASIYYSTNNGVTWIQKNFGFMMASTVFKTSTALYSSTNNYGIYRSTNNGAQWTNITQTSEFWSIRSFGEKNSKLFCGVNAAGIYVSVNDGFTWTPSGLPGKTIFCIYPSGSNIFAGSGNGLFYSTNEGVNWNATSLITETIFSIHENQGRHFAGGSGSGIYMSTNGGTAWNQFSIAPGPLSSFASINNYVFAGGGIGVYVSSNNGTNWSPTPFTGYTYCLASSGNAVFAGTDKNGFFISEDYGQTWRNVNGNLGSKASVLRMFVSGNDLYGATLKTSVVKAPINSLVDIPISIGPYIPTEFALNQNYPNPFNPTTTIKFDVKKAGNVLLKIYDVLGNEVTSLIDERKEAGRYTITLDAGKYNLASGMYFYKLSAKGFEDTKKMVLVK